MASTSMNIRLDNEVKKQAEILFSEFGLNMTTAVNMFLRQAIREQRIPFELKLDIQNVETIQDLEESEALLADPKSKRYKDIESLLAELKRL